MDDDDDDEFVDGRLDILDRLVEFAVGILERVVDGVVGRKNSDGMSIFRCSTSFLRIAVISTFVAVNLRTCLLLIIVTLGSICINLRRELAFFVKKSIPLHIN